MERADLSPREPSVQIADLAVHFAGRAALHGINLTLEAGQMTVVIGPSGSGKTTLLRAINRLNECFPNCRTVGTVRIRLDGRWVDAYRDFRPVAELRRRVGMVFQTPNVLPCSIEKNLSIPLIRVAGLSKSRLPGRIEWALREVELWDEVKDRLRHNALTLSGGQQQRLCLARALALKPQVLLLDEPTASLDFRATQKIERLLLKLRDRYTILAISHSLGQTRRLADRVIVLRDGRLAEQFDREHLEDAETFEALLEEIF